MARSMQEMALLCAPHQGSWVLNYYVMVVACQECAHRLWAEEVRVEDRFGVFQAATEDLTSWEDLHGDYWVVDPNNGCIWEWGTIYGLVPDGGLLQRLAAALNQETLRRHESLLPD
jgi:hypothetical protein